MVAAAVFAPARISALCIGAILTVWATTALPLWLQGAVWGALLLVGAAVLRRRRVPVFGPVLPFDLVRTARNRRYFFLRALYAGLLFLVLVWIYGSWLVAQGGNLRDLLQPQALDIHSAARFATLFFWGVVSLQFLAAVLLTPIYLAGAVAEEKERGTLEYLFASQLLDREIVLSKLVARLGNLLCVLLAALPVLAITEVLGGIDPGLLLASFVLIGLMTITLGSLSVLVSVYAKRMIDALFWTYFWVGVYLFLSWWFSHLLPWFIWIFTGWFPKSISLGNPLVLVQLLESGYATVGDQRQFLIDLMTSYALAHLTLTVLFVMWAVRRLRAVALQPEGPPASPWRRAGFDFPPRRRRKKMTDNPLLWKEVHGEALLGSPRLSSFIIYIQLVLGWCLVPVMCISLPMALDDGMSTNRLVRPVSDLLSGVMLLTVAAYAAGSISRERERGTFDSLVVLPLESDAILASKWLGAVLSVRPIWWCLGTVWVLGVLTTGIHPLALPLLLLSWASHAALYASLGLCFSLRFTSTMRATLATFATIFVGAVALRLLGNFGNVLFDSLLPRPASYWLARLCADGLAPFAGLNEVCFSLWMPGDFRGQWPVLAGVAGQFLMAGLLWQFARRRFRLLANRDPEQASQPLQEQHEP